MHTRTTLWSPIALATAVLALAGAACASAEPPAEDDEADYSSSAPASLRVPIVERVKVGRAFRKRLVAARNASFAAAGVEPIPEHVTLDKGTGGTPFMSAVVRAEENAEQIGEEDGIEIFQLGDGSDLEGGFGKGKQGICYLGAPRLAIALVLSLRESVFSEQLTVKAWKYRKRAYDADGKPLGTSSRSADEADFPDIWREWRGEGDAILMISSTSDGGEESRPTILRRCR